MYCSNSRKQDFIIDGIEPPSRNIGGTLPMVPYLLDTWMEQDITPLLPFFKSTYNMYAFNKEDSLPYSRSFCHQKKVATLPPLRPHHFFWGANVIWCSAQCSSLGGRGFLILEKMRSSLFLLKRFTRLCAAWTESTLHSSTARVVQIMFFPRWPSWHVVEITDLCFLHVFFSTDLNILLSFFSPVQ